MSLFIVLFYADVCWLCLMLLQTRLPLWDNKRLSNPIQTIIRLTENINVRFKSIMKINVSCSPTYLIFTY